MPELTPQERQRLTSAVRLVIDQGGYLDTRSEAAIQRQMITLDEFIKIRFASGATDAQIMDELRADLENEVPRVFGFKGDMKNALMGGVNVAATDASVATIVGTLSREDFENKLFRWQSNGINVCPDCEGRHGEEDTMENWIVRGPPARWGSRCQSNCQCTLVDTGVILEPIKVGVQEV